MAIPLVSVDQEAGEQLSLTTVVGIPRGPCVVRWGRDSAALKWGDNFGGP